MYEELRKISFRKNKGRFYDECQNIVTINMEYSSYEGPAGFDSIMYLWTASVENGRAFKLFHGRTYEELSAFLKELSECAVLGEAKKVTDPIIRQAIIDVSKKVNIRIYDHNLDWDFQYLRNMKGDKAFSNREHVLARSINHPFYAWYTEGKAAMRFINTRRLYPEDVDVWNINEKIGAMVHKKEMLSYITPVTTISEEEIKSSFEVNKVIHYGMSKYRDKYMTLENIPLTQAGEVRRVLRAVAPKAWKEHCQEVMRSIDFETYSDLCKMFIGGSMYSCSLYRGQLIEDIDSFDMSSAYPGVMSSKMFPVGKWEDCKDDSDKSYFYYYEVEATGVRSRGFNLFWPIKKGEGMTEWESDDGMLVYSDYFKSMMTDVDLSIFKDCYSYDSIKILRMRRSKAGYLPKQFVEIILRYYNGKTLLKGTASESEYRHNKVYSNVIYGAFVTKTITDKVTFGKDGWSIDPLNKDNYEKRRDEESNPFTLYQIGVWVTAFCRRRLWDAVLANDFNTVSLDTDCLKGKISQDTIEKVNESIKRDITEAAKHYGIPESEYSPKGQTIGCFIMERHIDKFKTLGSKKSVCEFEDGTIKTSVSGIDKEALLKKVSKADDLNEKLSFSKEESGCFMFVYKDKRTEYTDPDEKIKKKRNGWEPDYSRRKILKKDVEFVTRDIYGNEYVCKENYSIGKCPVSFDFGVRNTVRLICDYVDTGMLDGEEDKTAIFSRT